MKRIIILIAALILLLCSCASEPSMVLTEGSDFYKITAENYSQSERLELTAQESSEITVTAAVNADKGAVDILCNNALGDIVSQYNDLKEGSYSFRLTGPDSFYITVTCDSFSGTCNITWETIGAVSTTEETPEVTIVDPKA